MPLNCERKHHNVVRPDDLNLSLLMILSLLCIVCFTCYSYHITKWSILILGLPFIIVIAGIIKYIFFLFVILSKNEELPIPQNLSIDYKIKKHKKRISLCRISIFLYYMGILSIYIAYVLPVISTWWLYSSITSLFGETGKQVYEKIFNVITFTICRIYEDDFHYLIGIFFLLASVVVIILFIWFFLTQFDNKLVANKILFSAKHPLVESLVISQGISLLVICIPKDNFFFLINCSMVILFIFIGLQFYFEFNKNDIWSFKRDDFYSKDLLKKIKYIPYRTDVEYYLNMSKLLYWERDYQKLLFFSSKNLITITLYIESLIMLGYYKEASDILNGNSLKMNGSYYIPFKNFLRGLLLLYKDKDIENAVRLMKKSLPFIDKIFEKFIYGYGFYNYKISIYNIYLNYVIDLHQNINEGELKYYNNDMELNNLKKPIDEAKLEFSKNMPVCEAISKVFDFINKKTYGK